MVKKSDNMKIFINLPVKDLNKTIEFFTKLGFRFNPQFTDKNATCMIINENIFVMLLIEKFFKTFIKKDFHCVTHWSKYDVNWSGVLWKDFLKHIKVKPEVKAVMFYGSDGYSTNNIIEDLDEALLAYALEGKPIPKEHGWPLRIIIPHLYGWKGSKFLNKIEFMKENKPGFWEVRGYHLHGDAQKEERYS